MAQRPKPLTEKERVFIERYAATDDAAYAAEKAGYPSPSQRASDNLKNPRILEEVEKERIRTLTEQIMPLALKKHCALLGEDAPAGPAVQAIKLAYEQYGLLTGASSAKGDLFALPAGDLAQAAEALAAEIRERQAAAKTIDLEPEEPFFE